MYVRSFASVSASLAIASALGAQTARALTPPGLPPLVADHCGACHTGPDAERAFDVERLFAAPPAPDDDRAALAVQRVRSLTMPPPDADTMPDATARRALVLAFASVAAPAPGARVATVRRLSRTQFEHTVRALFGIDWLRRDLLPDDVPAHGFDCIGDVAGITPQRFECYAVVANDLAAQVLADPAARARVFGADPPLEDALAALLERAFRRPPEPDELAARVQLAGRLRADGRDDTAVHTALLQSVLLSPAFLLRAEHGRRDDPNRLDAFELAGRLSFLLTSAAPDDALLARARTGALHDATVLAAEARRLVAVTGGRRLADDFGAQWLHYRDVLHANADFRRYPEIWNHRLRPSLYEEAARLFAAVVCGDLPVTTLLDADFTFVDATLAKLYGLPAIDGGEFVRMTLPDRRRGGVLGTGAMLMASSYPLRTSPVLRGKWILETLLDAATPPPPPNAGRLPNDDVPVDGASLRAQLEHHRRRPSCAACHAVLDPLGFALENYDVLGRWRDDLHGAPVDARGSLPDGTGLDGPIALKDALLARRDDFVRTMAARLLTFAVGRPMLAADEPELQRIVAASAAAGHRFLALLDAVVTSPLFTLRDPGAHR